MQISVGGTDIAGMQEKDFFLERGDRHDFTAIATEMSAFVDEKGISVGDLDVAGLLSRLFSAGVDLEGN